MMPCNKVMTSLCMLTLLLTTRGLLAGEAEKTAFEVEIVKFQYLPQEITINVGESVRWINKEKRQYHSVWFEQAGDPEPDYFFPGESYTRTFDKTGSFPYHCGPHPKMTGVVHVK